MPRTPSYILGGYQTDFARSWVKDGGDLFDLLREAALGACEAASVEPADIDVIHIGNLAAEVFCGQAQLSGLVATVDPAFGCLPSMRHEAACASGSMAILAAMADIESGRYGTALVVGAEILRNFAGQEAGQMLGMATWQGQEATQTLFPWPFMFSQVADAVAERHGLRHEHLMRIAEINLQNARRNPNAQTRDWILEPGSFDADEERNPVVEGRLRKQDCGRITDGAAAVVIASADDAIRHRRSLPAVPVIRGWGHRTAPMLLMQKLAMSAGQPYLFPHLRQTIQEAFDRAGVRDVGEVDVIETHDCTTITEYVALDHFGLTPPGESWRAIEEGTIESTGTTPVNPSGGLIGLGHPVGATGVRMLLDASKQVAGLAGDYQVDGARTAAVLNIGGSFTTTAAFVVGTGVAREL